jgi:hypothetical protein
MFNNYRNTFSELVSTNKNLFFIVFDCDVGVFYKELFSFLVNQ